MCEDQLQYGVSTYENYWFLHRSDKTYQSFLFHQLFHRSRNLQSYAHVITQARASTRRGVSTNSNIWSRKKANGI
ncbi:hypothetical protein Glove_368g23 [Diversispora epigaea]|uniref:Uncharacterized protein n=1 Tax=Diversispora epigaea TaxID=1348612 RepID=A0A397H6S2_9GLOM|nr:hypothetical protein Glove_368g23 [Diversispora epigaea]